MLCLKCYKPTFSLSCNGGLCCVFAIGFLRLRLVPKKGGKSTVQHRIPMDDAYAQWWLQNKTCVPGMPKAGSFASFWKRQVSPSSVNFFFFFLIYHSLKRKCGKAGNGEEGPSNFCPPSQINFFFFLKLPALLFYLYYFLLFSILPS